MASLILLITVTLIQHLKSEHIVCTGGPCSCPLTPPTGEDETCVLDCAAEDICKGQLLTCRSGDPCYILCNAKNTCSEQATISAGAATQVTISCRGDNACRDAISIQCGTGDCKLECNGFTSCSQFGTINVATSKSFLCSGTCPVNIPAPFSSFPTKFPTKEPTTATGVPITSQPTTAIPTTNNPTTSAPTTSAPTTATPTTNMPTTTTPTTNTPTGSPITLEPTTVSPTANNPTTASPTDTHSSANPTNNPISTISPTNNPTNIPTEPSKIPTKIPSIVPTDNPTQSPTNNPISKPTKYPTPSPSDFPFCHNVPVKKNRRNAGFIDVGDLHEKICEFCVCGDTNQDHGCTIFDKDNWNNIDSFWKDLFMEYCELDSGCSFEQVTLKKSVQESTECGCDIFECQPIGNQANLYKFQIVLYSSFVIVILLLL